MQCSRCKEELSNNQPACLSCGTKRAEPSYQGETNRSLGRYVLTSLLWENQFGGTYLARDPLVGKSARIVAVKTPMEGFGETTSQVRRDGPRLQKLSHPALVPVLHVSANDDGRVIIGYEDASGTLLSEQIVGGKTLRLEAALPLLRMVAESLKFLYDEGFPHGSLSPETLLLRGPGGTGPTIRVLDIGVAHFARLGKVPVIRLETIAGAWPYLAPEIWKGSGNIDSRTDVYAMSVLLYRVLSGKLPYTAKDAAGFMSAHCLSPVPSLNKIEGRANVAELDEVLRKGLSKRREERFATPADLIQRLTEVSAAPSSSHVLRPEPMKPKVQTPKPVVDAPSLPQQTRPIELTQQIRHRKKAEPAPLAAPIVEGSSSSSIWLLLVGIFLLALGGMGAVIFLR